VAAQLKVAKFYEITEKQRYQKKIRQIRIAGLRPERDDSSSHSGGVGRKVWGEKGEEGPLSVWGSGALTLF